MRPPPAFSAFALTAGVFALADQAIKRAVAGVLEIGESWIVVRGILNLTHVRNRGGAFGVLAGFPPAWGRGFFILATLAALAFVFYLYRYRTPERAWGRMALPLIFGGGLGNLVDRILYGEVIDFVDFYYGSYHWPAFNLADSGISVGVALLALEVLWAPAPSPSAPG